MKTCVAYFSRSGNTKKAAEYLANKIGATIIALDDNTNYKGFIGFLKGGMKASFAKNAKIHSAIYREISKFDRIVLATPVWAGKNNACDQRGSVQCGFSGESRVCIDNTGRPGLQGV